MKISVDKLLGKLQWTVAKTMWNQLYTCKNRTDSLTSQSFDFFFFTISFKLHVNFDVLPLPTSLCIFHYCPKIMTKKFVKIVGSYFIDACVMLKSVTNNNFSSSTCLNFENFV